MQRVGKLDEVCHNKGAQKFGQAERTLDNSGREQKERSIRLHDIHEWECPAPSGAHLHRSSPEPGILRARRQSAEQNDCMLIRQSAAVLRCT